ncbi:MAG: hypothetical protein IJR43_04355, partial [Synergistaceae bacterium]|nr:hypothetical protein [Synergistaceae bacterium]
ADSGWAKLTDQQRAWIMEAGKIVQKANQEYSAAAEEKVINELKAAGVHVVDVENKAEWVEACQPTIKANTSSQADLYKKIVDLQ